MRGKTILVVFDAKITRHSEKPTKFYDLIKSKTLELGIDIFTRHRP